MNSSKKRCLIFLVLTLFLLGAAGGLTALIDPFFHYHPPLPFLQYPIRNQRYQNDGIAKQFSYDAMITGTSMTENFKASEFDQLFGVHSVKTSFNGSTFKETADHLRRAIAANPDLRVILRGLDGWNLFDPWDHMRTDAIYPDYLYDDSLLNDVEYLFNKDILCDYTLDVVKHTLKGLPTTDFDAYSSWDTSLTGRERLLGIYQRPEKRDSMASITEAEADILRQTLEENVLSLARENPDIDFYYFFTPYSIYYLDEQNQYGILLRQFQGYQLASQLMLEYDNIHLFSFFCDYDTILNPDCYTDPTHYSAPINSLILQRIAAGEYQLTKENYASHWQEVTDFYTSFNYETLFP